ncbi:MAG: hypothetical protein JXR32_01280 [Anaerolineaceae bacterium]|nr:hypothetical protein [Anaerolineaceae bacterium]
MMFGLGTSIADYLGYRLDGWRILLGLVTVWLILSSSWTLYAYFELIARGTQPFSNRKEAKNGQVYPSPQTLLTGVIVLLTFSVAFGYTLSRSATNPGLVVLMLVGLILSSVLFYGQPRMVFSGYGELIQALFICNLVPAFAFSIHAPETHPSLLPVTFPLVLIFLGITLTLELERFASDSKQGRQSLLIRLGWQRGIPLQHILILTGFVLLAAAPLFGVAWRLVWPALMAFPVVILEIWLVNRVALGLPPRWPILRITAWVAVILPTYLLAITFWQS